MSVEPGRRARPVKSPRRPAALLALAAFCATGLVWAAATPPARDGRHIVLADLEPYSRGAYGAFASPWSTFFDKSLVRGVDYSDDITVDPATFPHGTVVRWRWPPRASRKTGVWGYMTLCYGNYDGGEPQVRVPPRRADEIRVLREEVQLSHGGLSSFNVLNEFYLTAEAGKTAAKVIEIGYMLHASPEAKALFASARPIGVFTDGAGRRWDARLAGRFCIIMPAAQTDVLDGAIDIKSALDFLRSRRVIRGDEWFNGIALGVEPLRGAGELHVRRWIVTYG